MKQLNRFTAILLLSVMAGVADPGFCQAPSTPDAESAAIIQYLERTIDWYRLLDVLRRLATDPNEMLIVNDDQRTADRVVQLAFEFARADAEFIAKQAPPEQPAQQGRTGSRYQSLMRMSDTLSRQVQDTRKELETLRQKLASATGRQRDALETQLSEVQSELSLIEARRNAMRDMTEFVGGTSANGMGATGLRAEIETLARTIPAALESTAQSQESVSPANRSSNLPSSAGERKIESAGVWALAMDLLALNGKKRALTDALQRTDSVAEVSRQLRTPLVSRLREMSRRGDELAKQADTGDRAELEQAKKDFDSLTVQFKQISAVVMPLSKQSILMNLYRRNLSEWQDSVRSRFASELRTLLLKVAFLAGFLAVVFGASTLWRRTILRYVHDARRRHQFLLLRKIVMWFIIALILVFSFANELGSVATFAGLITAGVAVALQGVILSVVGYFFLIGKFGIRVGDVVHVAGVTGEVVDIGLVRFHLLELVGGGGKTPSGRVAAFANAIVFQSSAGFFKQVPGTSFVWHEVSVSLAADCDYKSAEERLRQAVEAVFEDYKDEMEKQHRQLVRTLTVAPVSELHPTSRLRLTPSGPEVVIRYPVDLRHGGEIDDRVTFELLKAVEREPRVKLAGSGTSGIKLSADLSGSNPRV